MRPLTLILFALTACTTVGEADALQALLDASFTVTAPDGRTTCSTEPLLLTGTLDARYAGTTLGGELKVGDDAGEPVKLPIGPGGDWALDVTSSVVCPDELGCTLDVTLTVTTTDSVRGEPFVTSQTVEVAIEAGGTEGYVDADGDGVGVGDRLRDCDGVLSLAADAGDCDDGDPNVFPGAPERCNGADDDCDSTADEGIVRDRWYPDLDRDGFGDEGATPVETCPGDAQPADTSADATDCDDTRADVFPGAPELCDGVDNDCADGIDEGLAFFDVWPDLDGDDFGDATASPVSACADGPAVATNGADCDDAQASVNPGVAEICDGLDNDCQYGPDDGLPFFDAWPDLDGDGQGDETVAPVAVCALDALLATNGTDCDDTEAEVYEGADEVCDGLDNDCDDATDEGFPFFDVWPDLDGDGFGDEVLGSVSTCEQPAGTALQGGDCRDDDELVNPAAVELCDGDDNDCSGDADDGLLFVDTWPDLDGDDFGDETATPVFTCAPHPDDALQGGDCDDRNDQVSPAVAEICDGLDQDCVGGADNGLLFFDIWPDTDDDGFGDDAVSPDTVCADRAGWVSDGTDCDDDDDGVNPSAVDVVANGVDDDCDGTHSCYADADLDGFGSGPATDAAPGDCDASLGWSSVATDCDPVASTVYPGAPELLCDGVRQDCDLAGDAVARWVEGPGYAFDDGGDPGGPLGDLLSSLGTSASTVELCPNEVYTGAYTLTQGIVLIKSPVLGQPAVITPTPGASAFTVTGSAGLELEDLVLAGNLSGGNPVQGELLVVDVGASAVLDKVDLLNGEADTFGGAAAVAGELLWVEGRCDDSFAGLGGGCLYVSGEATLLDVAMSGNTVPRGPTFTGLGGGIYADGGTGRASVDWVAGRCDGDGDGGNGGCVHATAADVRLGDPSAPAYTDTLVMAPFGTAACSIGRGGVVASVDAVVKAYASTSLLSSTCILEYGVEFDGELCWESSSFEPVADLVFYNGASTCDPRFANHAQGTTCGFSACSIP